MNERRFYRPVIFPMFNILEALSQWGPNFRSSDLSFDFFARTSSLPYK